MNIISIYQVHSIKQITHFTTTLICIMDNIIDILKFLDKKFTLCENKKVTFLRNFDNLWIIKIFSFYKNIGIYFYMFMDGKAKFSIL